jgi:hypothetical protein
LGPEICRVWSWQCWGHPCAAIGWFFLRKFHEEYVGTSSKHWDWTGTYIYMIIIYCKCFNKDIMTPADLAISDFPSNSFRGKKYRKPWKWRSWLLRAPHFRVPQCGYISMYSCWALNRATSYQILAQTEMRLSHPCWVRDMQKNHGIGKQ